MIDIGIANFLILKKVKVIEGVNLYLDHKEVKFSKRNHRLVNSYIQENFPDFATFIDKSIKSGRLKGVSVKLNTAYEEARIVSKERNELRLKILEHYGIKEDQISTLRKQSEGMLDSFVMKMGYKRPDLKTEIRVPYLRFAIFFREHPELLSAALEYQREEKFIINTDDPGKIKLRYSYWRQEVRTGPVKIRQKGKDFVHFSSIEEADDHVAKIILSLEQ